MRWFPLGSWASLLSELAPPLLLIYTISYVLQYVNRFSKDFLFCPGPSGLREGPRRIASLRPADGPP
nr:MAG TPA: hypothetical protein [Caudoviricetes sp.]